MFLCFQALIVMTSSVKNVIVLKNSNSVKCTHFFPCFSSLCNAFLLGDIDKHHRRNVRWSTTLLKCWRQICYNSWITLRLINPVLLPALYDFSSLLPSKVVVALQVLLKECSQHRGFETVTGESSLECSVTFQLPDPGHTLGLHEKDHCCLIVHTGLPA